MNPQAGWYPDPADESLERYWDGAQWTNDVQHSVAEPEAVNRQPRTRAEAREWRRRHQVDVERDKQNRAEQRRAKRQERVEQREVNAEASEHRGIDRADILAAADRMSWKLGSKREVRKLAEHMWPDETARMITAGTYGPGRGVVVLTDKRLFFLKDGLTSNVSEDFPLSKISSIQWAGGMMLGKITVFASGNQSVIANMMKDDGRAIAAAVRADVSGLHEQEAPPHTSTTAPDHDPLAQLKTLGELRDAGVLTNEEFELKKAALLDQIG